jgi:hypothetical protein
VIPLPVFGLSPVLPVLAGQAGAGRGLPCLQLEGKEGRPLEKELDAAMVEARIEGARPSLAEITEWHMAAQKAAADVVREWDSHRANGDVSSVAYASALLAVVTEEAKARRIVMEYQPLDYQESIRKLTYISAFLIATEVRLEETEMAAVMEAAAPFG